MPTPALQATSELILASKSRAKQQSTEQETDKKVKFKRDGLIAFESFYFESLPTHSDTIVEESLTHLHIYTSCAQKLRIVIVSRL